MNLSNDLISQFVKMTNDKVDKKNNKTSYGTAIEYDGEMYVKIDGSDLLTPVETTSNLHANDRVIVNIENHNAIVNGNITNPSVGGVEIIELDNKLQLEFKEGLEELLLIFKDGYYEGVTTVNKDGIMVSHTEYGGYTKIKYDGFYLYDGTADILKCTADGLLYSGTITASDIKSIDGTFQIDKNGNITGASFKSSKGGNFSIDENGDITAKGLTVEDTVSSNTIICNDILNKAYPKTLTNHVNIYIDPINGNDDSECFNGSVFKNLQAAIDKLPKFLNGKVVYLHLNSNIVENLLFRYFVSGEIYLFLHGFTLYGHIKAEGMEASLSIHGGTNKDSTIGVIHPSLGAASNGRTTSISVNWTKNIYLNNINLYAPDNQVSGLTGHKQGVSISNSGYCYLSNVKILNCGIGFNSSFGSQIHSNTTTGVASAYGFEASAGGKISLSNNSQSGGTLSATNTTMGGQIWSDSPLFETGGETSSEDKASSSTSDKTVTYTSNSAQALQYAGTSNAFWRTDCTPKVGDWGYGAHTGWWFFGDAFENIIDSEVSKVEITFTREKAGYYAATTHHFYLHDYEVQPETTSPINKVDKIATVSVGAQSSYTITITDRSIIDKIKNAKGICSIPPSQSKAYYSVMSAVMKVKFTYK